MTTHIPEEEFKPFIADLQNDPDYVKPELFGLFKAQKSRDGRIISGKFLSWNYEANFGSAAILLHASQALKHGMTRHVRELVIGFDAACVERALLCFPESIIREAQGDKHLNVQALQAIAKAEDDQSLYHAVFIFENEARVESIPAALLKLTCHVEETNHYMLYTDGLKDALKPLVWAGEKAFDPYDMTYYRSEGIAHEYEEGLNILPPGLRGGIVTG